MFFSSNFFKQMVALGISDSGTRDLINFRFQNTTSPESGWYEFSTSNQLIIKPRDFSISIISDDYDNSPHREGYVGPAEPAGVRLLRDHQRQNRRRSGEGDGDRADSGDQRGELLPLFFCG